MSSSRRSIIAGAAFIVILLYFGLRPVEAVDRAAAFAAGWLSYPYRWLGELEIIVLGGGAPSDPAWAMIAEENLLDLRRRELATAVANREELKSRPGISANVIIHNSLDATFIIDRGLRDGVAQGDPVTFGDSFAGIVATAETNQSTVRYLWHRKVRICASNAADASQRAVLIGAGEGLLKIEASQPRNFSQGIMLQLAPSPDGDALDIARGFLIGSVRPVENGQAAWVEPDVNIRGERFLHVIIRTRGAAVINDPSAAPEPWSKVSLSPAGDATPERKSSLTKTNKIINLMIGAAVARDGWLLGRIERAGGPISRVRFVEDPGFSFDAILLPSDGAPVSLGRVRCIGEDGPDLLFVAEDKLILVTERAAGSLVSGAAEASVPKGIRVGNATIENGKIRVARPFRGADFTEALVAARGAGGF